MVLLKFVSVSICGSTWDTPLCDASKLFVRLRCKAINSNSVERRSQYMGQNS